EDKEVSVMFGPEKFGKRPDVLTYENDVLELAKKKASSFHCSEELWHNPLNIVTGMKRHELDELRKGWDFILDVDCPDWEFSKLITHLFVKTLQVHGITSIGVKFSGNKGFHIVVPFEAFPESIETSDGRVALKDVFPEGPRKLATYILSYVTANFTKTDLKQRSVVFDGRPLSFDQFQKVAKKSSNSLFGYKCLNDACTSGVFDQNPAREKKYFPCSHCGTITPFRNQQEDIISCPTCSKLVKLEVESSGCPVCKSRAGFDQFINLLSVVEVDTVLIASRHLYRMPYSLHEKSGLISLPIGTEEILSFEKKRADPQLVSFDVPFINRSICRQDEAKELVTEAFSQELQSLRHIHADIDQQAIRDRKKIELPSMAIPEEFFPPCIKNILKGMEDGKKRALFVLINFLRVSGWEKDAIEELTYAWNERNPEPLKEQYLKGQLSQLKKEKAPLPPPNCNNKDYYKSLLICTPDEFCPKIRNPAMYAKRKSELASKRTPKRSGKKQEKTSKKDEKSKNKTIKEN
ncbi:MAG: hypothetical protein KDK61_08880, partial [Simkania sp.]|nr:hypothetical protein [Simkania sp.]